MDLQQLSSPMSQDAQLAKLHNRAIGMRACGWKDVKNEFGDVYLQASVSGKPISTIMYEGGNGLMDITDEEYEGLLQLGVNCMMEQDVIDSAKRKAMERDQAADAEVLRDIHLALIHAKKTATESKERVRLQAYEKVIEGGIKQIDQAIDELRS